MSELKPKYTSITLGGKEYGMLFNLNAIDAIQDRFDVSITEFGDMISKERTMFKGMKAFIAIAVNEAIDDSETGEPHITEAFVGRKIAIQDLINAKSTLFEAFTASMPEKEDGEEEDPTKSGQ